MKNGLHDLWETVQTVGLVLEYVFGAAVVIMFAACLYAAYVVVVDRRADAESARTARRVARENPAREMPGGGAR